MGPSKNKIVSEVFGVTTEKYVELSVYTHPKYRRQNLAKIICSQFIREILATGREPIWACDKANKNSIKLAGTLEFRKIQNYQFKVFIKEKLRLICLPAYRYARNQFKKLFALFSP